MRAFFAQPANKVAMQLIFENWVGTPFRHASRAKNGIDCTQLIAACMLDAGILTKVDAEPFYSRNWFIHGKEEFVIASINKNLANLQAGLQVNEIEKSSSLLFGDVLLFATATRLSNHAAFYAGEDTIFHAVNKLGTRYDQYYQYQAKLTHVFRLHYKD